MCVVPLWADSRVRPVVGSIEATANSLRIQKSFIGLILLPIVVGSQPFFWDFA